MKRVVRSEVVNRREYNQVRDSFRRTVLLQKDQRRIHLGNHLTFLFENHDTVLYQIQEMIRAESIDGEKEIQHEMDTYNELIGNSGELRCTLLIEIADPADRAEMLRRWRGLPETLYLVTRSGKRISAEFDSRQVGDDRISSVQYLTFRLGDDVPDKIGSSHPEYRCEAPLSAAQAAALCTDLIA